MDFMDFILRIIGSIVSGLAVLVLSPFFSRKARGLFLAVMAKILNSDLIYVYKNKEDVKNDLKDEVKKAKYLKIITARGNDFKQDEFESMLDKKKVYDEVKILFPNPYYYENIDWFHQREIELANFDNSFGMGVLKEETKANILFLSNHVNDKRINLRLHQFPLIGRIVITDSCIFFTPMLKDRYIRRNKTYKFSVGEMHCYYTRLFDQIWSSAEDIKTVIEKTKADK